ncbi:MAG: lipopolysaccharide biosynthesis protein [Agathobaculum desmolans]|uniref:lipopolysaccharide biosynthesis protein n=1 Tax=Agathobaculum desmolans TaxID=39484 RepID=UPI0039962103
MSSKNTMTRDAMLFLPAKIAEGLLVIACSSLYTHLFYQSTVGTFNFINFNVQIAYLILAGWMANAATRYVGEEFQHDQGRGLFSTVSTVYLLICAAVAVFCCTAAAVTGDRLYLGFLTMFCSYTVFQILNSALIQLGRMKASISLSLLSAVLKLAVAYVLVYGMDNPASPFPAIAANTVADGLAGLGAIAALGLPAIVRLRWFSRALFGRFLKYGLPLMGVSISVTLLNQIDKYLVVGFFNMDVYGIYSSNNSIAAGLFTMISVGIMRGVYPAVLRAWREGGQTAAKPLLDQGVRLYLLIAAPAVAGLTAVSLPMSRFLFAEGYEAGAPVIAYTALAMLFMGLTEYANKAYELEQSTVQVLQNSAAAAVIKVLSSIVLLRVLGFTGGALGSVVAFASYFVITCVRVRRRFLFRLAPASVLRILLSALLCGAAAYGCTLLPVGNLVRLVLAVPAGALVYAVCIIVSGEGRAELQAIRHRLHR